MAKAWGVALPIRVWRPQRDSARKGTSVPKVRFLVGVVEKEGWSLPNGRFVRKSLFLAHEIVIHGCRAQSRVLVQDYCIT